MFYIKLALACGRADWMRWLSEISPVEMNYIMALHNVEPVIPIDRDDLRGRAMTAYLMNAWGSEASPADLIYLPKDIEDQFEEVTEESTAMTVTTALGAIPVRRV